MIVSFMSFLSFQQVDLGLVVCIFGCMFYLLCYGFQIIVLFCIVPKKGKQIMKYIDIICVINGNLGKFELRGFA